MNKPPKHPSQRERPVLRFALGTVEKLNRNVIQKPTEAIDAIDFFLTSTLETAWRAHVDWAKDAHHRSGMHTERDAYKDFQKKSKRKKVVHAREKIDHLERKVLEREVRLMTFEKAVEAAVQNQVRNINAHIRSFALKDKMGIETIGFGETSVEELLSTLKELLLQIQDNIKLFEPPTIIEAEDSEQQQSQAVLQSLGTIEAEIKDLLKYLRREQRSHAARDAFFEFVKGTQDSIDLARMQRLQKETPEGRMMQYQKHKAKVRELFITTDALRLDHINKKRVIAESRSKTSELFAGRNPNFKQKELEREGADSLFRFINKLIPQAEKFESVGRLRTIVEKYPTPKDLGDMPLGYDVECKIAETTLPEQVREHIRTLLYTEQYLRGNSVEGGLHPREAVSVVRYHQVSPNTLKQIQHALQQALVGNDNLEETKGAPQKI